MRVHVGYDSTNPEHVVRRLKAQAAKHGSVDVAGRTKADLLDLVRALLKGHGIETT